MSYVKTRWSILIRAITNLAHHTPAVDLLSQQTSGTVSAPFSTFPASLSRTHRAIAGLSSTAFTRLASPPTVLSRIQHGRDVVSSWWVFDGYLKFFAKSRRRLSSCLISDRSKVFEGVEKEELAEGRHYARVAGPNAVDAHHQPHPTHHRPHRVH